MISLRAGHSLQKPEDECTIRWCCRSESVSAQRPFWVRLRPRRAQARGPLCPINGHRQLGTARQISADFVAKVFLGWRSEIPKAADAFHSQQGEGPYRFIQNRSRASVTALKSN